MSANDIHWSKHFLKCGIFLLSLQERTDDKKKVFQMAAGISGVVSGFLCGSQDFKGLDITNSCPYADAVTFNPSLARLQAPEAAADQNLEQQESDITSQEASIHTPSPRRNGSVTNFQSPVRRGNSIRTISQSASRPDLSRGSGAGSCRSPTVTILPKHRLEHIPNRSHTLK